MQQLAPKTVAFFGASGGVGLAALKQTLAAGHCCVALCRDPSKITAALPGLGVGLDVGLDAGAGAVAGSDVEPTSSGSVQPSLSLVRGNAHDVKAVMRCLAVPSTASGLRLVDIIVSTIGGKLQMSRLTLDDPNVCAKGMTTLLEALRRLRTNGVSGTPRIVAVSTTGISNAGRDVPVAFVPLYHVVLRVPHADKRIMEETLVSSGELFTVVRPSLLIEDSEGGEGQHEKNEQRYQSVRVGIEDPARGYRISSAIGYTISRTDAGRWIAENLVLPESLASTYEGKTVTITY